MTPLDITLGTLPSVDTQVNNPRLRNGFVNSKNHIQLLPNIELVQALSSTQTILQSSFKDRVILATDNDIFYYENGNLVEVATITSSTFPVRMAENTQGQVCIVNGAGAWVFNQPTGNFFQLDSTLNGFDLTNPRDVTTLNTFLIVVGGTEKKWIVSNANDATQWAGNEVIETDSRLSNLIGIEVLDNNLFIFGEGGVQRWIPSLERTPNSFPFSQDPSYQDEYGCIATGSLVSRNNELFYLSNSGQVRMMSPRGARTITNDGIENIINNYQQTDGRGSYFYHKGHWFYQLSFSADTNAFVYSSKSKKWSEADLLFLSSTTNQVALKTGLYNLSSDYNIDSYWNLIYQSSYLQPGITDLKKRMVLGSVLIEMTQGKNETLDDQYAFLQLSKDNVWFGNAVKKPFSKVGLRLYQFRWFMNFVNNGFALRVRLATKTDVTITSASIKL